MADSKRPPRTPRDPARSYSVYGLGIRSVLPLPGLKPGSGRPDVVIRPGAVRLPAAGILTRGADHCVTESGIYLWSERGTRIRIWKGREILYDRAPGESESALRQQILTLAMAAVLHQRGMLLLHGSGVMIGGGAVAFLGGSGWGKSTLAAALHARGHRLVSDDHLRVLTGRGTPRVWPGAPEMKLWPAVARLLGYPLDPARKGSGKKRVRLKAGFLTSPVPLKRIYVLSRGGPGRIRPLSPLEATLELVRHSFCALLFHPRSAARNLGQCGRVVRQVKVLGLSVPRSPKALVRLVPLIERGGPTA